MHHHAQLCNNYFSVTKKGVGGKVGNKTKTLSKIKGGSPFLTEKEDLCLFITHITLLSFFSSKRTALFIKVILLAPRAI
jgi:hypothetical protein